MSHGNAEIIQKKNPWVGLELELELELELDPKRKGESQALWLRGHPHHRSIFVRSISPFPQFNPLLSFVTSQQSLNFRAFLSCSFRRIICRHTSISLIYCKGLAIQLWLNFLLKIPQTDVSRLLADDRDRMENKLKMMRNKYRKSGNIRFSSIRSRCSLPILIWILVGCLLILHLCSLLPFRKVESGDLKIDKIKHYELEAVEEENIQIPPPRGRRSPRAAKRRPKKPTTLIDEFLDENSQLRSIFFPGMQTAIDPRKEMNNSSYRYYPGRIWLDTDGHPIQAHGGGMLYDKKSRTYYWYGEYKDGPTYQSHKKGAARVDVIGVGCYSSKDLWTWKNEGIVLAAEQTNENHDLHVSNVLERPKVLFNEKTGKYVMWMHIDDANYTKASVGVAISDYPIGPFNYLYSKMPHGFESRDMTVFKDDDGIAYLVYSSEENSELHIGPLTDDYLDVSRIMRRILIGQHREAPALFKHKKIYYMITSGCSGWAPNEALAHAADSILGPWETLGNPCIGANKIFRHTTFFSQSTFVLPVSDLPGYYIFMADRWNPADLRDSRYIWLPMVVSGAADQPLEYDFGFPLWPRVSIYWRKNWTLPLARTT